MAERRLETSSSVNARRYARTAGPFGLSNTGRCSKTGAGSCHKEGSEASMPSALAEWARTLPGMQSIARATGRSAKRHGARYAEDDTGVSSLQTGTEAPRFGVHRSADHPSRAANNIRARGIRARGMVEAKGGVASHGGATPKHIPRAVLPGRRSLEENRRGSRVEAALLGVPGSPRLVKGAPTVSGQRRAGQRSARYARTRLSISARRSV